MSFKLIKRIIYAIWIIIVIGLVFTFLLKPNWFTPENLSALFSKYNRNIWIIYIIISFLRGFFLIPSTPFVLTGILLFPEAPVEVLVVSMLGVVFSASLLYFFSDTLGFSAYLEEQFPEKSKWVEQKLRGARAFGFILLWSIFPLVPTDLICYVAGILRIKYFKLMSGVILGEGLLNCLYVFVGYETLQKVPFFF